MLAQSTLAGFSWKSESFLYNGRLVSDTCLPDIRKHQRK